MYSHLTNGTRNKSKPLSALCIREKEQSGMLIRKLRHLVTTRVTFQNNVRTERCVCIYCQLRA